jgi:hypothetical protein
MTRRTRNFCAALDFLIDRGKAARTTEQWEAVGQLWTEIRTSRKQGGDMAPILQRYNITVPRGIKTTRPVPPRIEETKDYFVDDLLKTITCKKGNGH